MSDVLSQAEIDALFGSLQSGEIDIDEVKKEDTRTVKSYDFARPTKFSKENLRTLEIIFESYCRLVSNYLSGYLRIMTPIEVMNAEAITYYEYTNSLSNPVVLSMIDFAPLEGTIILEVSPNISYAFIDRILGGGGRDIDKVREFTEIEQIILERLFNKFTQLLIEPWESVMELHPRLNKIETNSQVVQIIPPNEMVALITISIKFGEVEGFINICIPYIVVEPVMDKINTRAWFTSNRDNSDISYTEELEELIRRTNIPIKAVLGQTHITVQEFLDLQVNDIIKLDRTIEDDVDIYVGEILKFKASPGSSRNRSAVQINEVILKEDG
ncbi:MAG: flagellar motor switch protein FliM [Epulopiscium sp. Nele67-Bin005]|nr:MAG: flagellar motor switch protein FliM [Epulopiscium sp. Nele67-Bin005]